MKILTVRISGFKSYIQAQTPEPLAGGLNVVIGRNGSGKSNLYNAIRFAMLDSELLSASGSGTSGGMASEAARRNLINTTGGNVTATVTVVFDNSKSDIPGYSTPEVELSRRFTPKSDESFINGKTASKQDVATFLESIGFAKASPFYMIQQNKVSSLAQATPAELLTLLQDASGASAYSRRRDEATKTLEDAYERRKVAALHIKDVEARLTQLEAEGKQLEVLRQLETQKKAMEWELKARDLRSAEQELAMTEEQKTKLEQVVAEKQSVLDDIHKRISDNEEELELVRTKIDSLEAKQEALRMRVNSAIAEDEADMFFLQDIGGGGDGEEEDLLFGDSDNPEIKLKIAKKELAQLEATRVATEKSLERLGKEKEKLVVDNEKLAAQKAEIELRLCILNESVAETGGVSRKKSKAQSAEDVRLYLETEKKNINAELEEKQRALKIINSRRVTIIANQEGSDVKGRKVEVQREQEQNRSKIQKTEAERNEAKNDLKQVDMRRRRLWRDETRQRKVLEDSRRQEHDAEVALIDTAPVGLARTLSETRKLREKNGVRGLLCELFTCPPSLYPAVESCAGNQLFSVIADDGDVAIDLATSISKMGSGGNQNQRRRNAPHMALTILPLSVIKEKAKKDAVPPASDEVIPLLSKLSYSEEMEPAVRHVFGKILLCKDITVGARIVAERNSNPYSGPSYSCVSLSGDFIASSGVMKGGYVKRIGSRMKAAGKLRESRERATKASTTLDTIGKDVTDVVNEYTRQQTKLDSLSAELISLRSEQINLSSRFSQITNEESAFDAQMAEIDKEVVAETVKVKSLEQRILTVEAMEQDVAQTKSLNVSTLTNELMNVSSALLSCTTSSDKNEGTKVLLETKLASLNRQIGEKKGTINELTEAVKQKQKKKKGKKGLRDEEMGGEDQMDTLSVMADLKSMSEEMSALRQRKDELDGEHENIIGDVSSISEQAAKAETELEGASVKSQSIKKRVNELAQSLRALGFRPDDEEVAKAADLTRSEIITVLSQIMKKISGHGSSINRRAFVQIDYYREQKKSLQVQLDEVEKGEAAINDVIRRFDEKKKQSLKASFVNVGREFSRIFNRLSAGGEGELVVITGPDPGDIKHVDDIAGGSNRNTNSNSNRSTNVDGSSGEGEGEEIGGKDVEVVDDERFEPLGLEPRVRFVHQEADIEPSLFSGGQKSTISLSLLLALQALDPSPIIFLDEADAALDVHARRSLADLLKDMTSPDSPKALQIIATTFHPELLRSSELTFVVKLEIGGSRIARFTEADSALLISNQDDNPDELGGNNK